MPANEADRYRFFVDALMGESAELDAQQAHHALNVLRLGPGSAVEVFDGAGASAVGAIERAGKSKANVRIVRRLPPSPRPQPEIELAFAVPKGKRLDWLLEKAAELGSARLSPVVFERSVVEPELSEHARGRWRGILVAAAKQCGTDFLPEIAAPRRLAEFLHAAAGRADDLRLLGDAEAVVTVPEAMAQRPAGAGVVVIVGPEGGLTGPERAAAGAAGFTPVRIGRWVLRVETAAIALLAAVTACGGRA